MTKAEAIALIEAHKNALMNPVDRLNWAWLRVILLHLDEAAWNTALANADRTFSR